MFKNQPNFRVFCLLRAFCIILQHQPELRKHLRESLTNVWKILIFSYSDGLSARWNHCFKQVGLLFQHPTETFRNTKIPLKPSFQKYVKNSAFTLLRDVLRTIFDEFWESWTTFEVLTSTPNPWRCCGQLFHLLMDCLIRWQSRSYFGKAQTN